MKICDVFADYRVYAKPVASGWIVGIKHPVKGDLRTAAYSNLEDALVAVRVWMEIFTDENEVENDPSINDELRGLMEEAVIRYEVGEDSPPSADDESFVADQRLREWFDRQMGE